MNLSFSMMFNSPRQDWRNRNRIKTTNGPLWLTIPITHDQHRRDIINVETVDSKWRQKHWRTIYHSYVRAPYFNDYKDNLEELYLGSIETRLTQINHHFLVRLCELLSIDTPIRFSMDYKACGVKTEKLVNICIQSRATEYITGHRARSILGRTTFQASKYSSSLYGLLTIP